MARRLLEKRGHTVVVATNGREAGMDAYLSEPISPTALFEVVDRMLLAAGNAPGPARAE